MPMEYKKLNMPDGSTERTDFICKIITDDSDNVVTDSWIPIIIVFWLLIIIIPIIIIRFIMKKFKKNKDD